MEKSKDKKIEEVLKSPAESQSGQIMSQIPKHSGHKVLIGIIIALVLLGSGGAWYWFKVYKNPTPIVEVKEEQDQEEPEAVKQTPVYLASDLPYDQKAKKSSNAVYSIDFENSSVDQVFLYQTAEKSRANVIGITDSAVYYFTNEKGYALDIKRYDRETKKTTVVVKTTDSDNHFEGIIMSPDKKSIVYTETCSYECTKSPQPLESDIKLLSLSDNSTKLIRHFSDQWPVFTLSAKWESPKYITLGKGCACDGVPSKSSIELMDVNNGNVVAVELDPDASEETISPDGKKILFSTFYTTDADDKAPTSHKASLKVKDIESGEVTSLLSSTKDSYSFLKWVSAEKVMVTITHVEKYEGGLIGWYPEGEKDVVVFPVANQSNKTAFITDAKNPEVYGVVYPFVVFSSENPFGQDAQTTKKLQFINLETATQGNLVVPAISSASIWN